MAKPAITKRVTKGSALTYSELDTNFQNLKDATINFTDGVNTLSMDLNDTVTIQGQTNHNVSVTVNEAGNVITVDNLLSNYTQEPMGFENRVDSIFSFDAGTRTFSIQSISPNYRVWTQGEMRVKTTTETKQIPNTSDLYYFYFDSNGDLQYTTTPNFKEHCLIASLQWNATDSNYYFLGEERHGIVMDWATHEYLNQTRGFQYSSGFLATNYTTSGTGSSNADAQIDLNGGVLYQEDIKIIIAHSNSPDYSLFEQDIQGPGRFPVMYHNGSTGQWRKDSATDYAVKQGTARITYNLNTAGTWTTPDAANNNYVAMWLVATANVKDGPIIALMGQREDSNIGNAQDNNLWTNLDLTNFPGNETRPLYRLIFKTGTGYANTPKCYLADIADYRTYDTRSSAGTGGGTGASGITAVVDDTTPQLGGDLDVNGFDITAAANQPITIAGVGSGSIFLTPDTGYVYLDGVRWPAADGTANQILKTDGAGNLSWTTIGTIDSGTTNNIAYYSGSNTIDDSTVLSLTNPTGASTPDLKFSGAAYFSVAAGAEMLIRGGVSQSTQIAVGLTSLTMSAGDTSVAKGKIEIDGANILIKPVTIGSNNGPLNIVTNSIVLGESSENATITTNGAGDLILNTASGTNSGSITIADGANQNITIAPNGTGKLSVSKAVYTSVSAGTGFVDAYDNATSYAASATVDFANFSGMIIINRQDSSSGNVALWLCGSGTTVKLGDSNGDQSGTIAANGGINGYRWTNNTGGTITASFAAIRTRTGG